MKKSIVFLLLIVFALSLSSCGAKKKGCGLTSDAHKLPPQETLVADQVNE